ncbi:MAG: hypothetical protein ACQES4_10810, partial [Bacillota bacterium]
DKIVIHELLKKANDMILQMDSFSFETFERNFLGKQGKLNNVHLAFTEHINQLKANGWDIFLKQEMGSGWMLHAMHEKKGDLIATVNTDDNIGAINFGMDK